MKRISRIIALVLVFAVVLTVPTSAATSTGWSAEDSGNLFNIWYVVNSDANGIPAIASLLRDIHTNVTKSGGLLDVVRQGTSLTASYTLRSANFLEQILSIVTDIKSVIATPEDIAMNESQTEEKEAWTSGFGSVDRTSSISDFSGFETGFKSWFSLPDVDISLLFDQVNTGFGGWFSQDTADALKAQYGTSTLDLDDESETPLLDENQRQVQEILSGGDGNWLTH